jgi:hypothetical protein
MTNLKRVLVEGASLSMDTICAIRILNGQAVQWKYQIIIP